jgi:hypothetical protein
MLDVSATTYSTARNPERSLVVQVVVPAEDYPVYELETSRKRFRGWGQTFRIRMANGYRRGKKAGGELT